MAAPMLLNPSNFYLSGPGRNVLSVNVPGVICIMFKMTGCEGSAAIQPTFYSLSGEERSVQYGIANIADERGFIAKMSSESNLRIAHTPTFAIFVNHIAYAKFDGKKTNLVSLRSFIRKVANEVRATQQQMGAHQQSSFVQHPQGYPPHQSPHGAPRHGGGHPGSSHQPPRGGYAPQFGGRGGPPQGGRAPIPSHLQPIEDDDEHSLKMPDSVTPHNTPWEASYRAHD